ncbi:MAG: CBS domain-containing protein, partial [Clostridiales bacterium]|nr:CBS domain-containing protein [Clostridiales bacterium]
MNSEQMKLFIIKEDANVVEALQQIDANTKGILFVVDAKDKLVGSVTDGDIRRWLIKTADLNGKIKNIINRNP